MMNQNFANFEEQKRIDFLQLQKSSQYCETTRWQWQCDADPWKEQNPANWTWQNYSDFSWVIIEQAFSLNKETVDLQNYQLDLKKMLQVNKFDKSRVRRVRRQVQSRLMMEMSQPVIFIPNEKTMNEAFGTIQHFLDYIMKRTPEAFSLYQRLKTLSLDSGSHEFRDITKKVMVSIEKGAEAREKIIKSRTGTTTTNFIPEAKKIVNEIKSSSPVLRDFLKIILKVYTMETFICYWLNELLRSEDWQEMNVLTPYLVCLVYTFQLSEYTIPFTKPKKIINHIFRLVSKQTLCLYRGTVLTEEHLKLYHPNKVKYFSWNGVTSTSRNMNVALNFVQFSLAKSTTPKIGVVFSIETDFASSKDCEGMIDVSQDSEYPDEQEIILAPGTVFRLIKAQKRENNIYEISLKVTKKFNKKEEAALLGALHVDAIQGDTAIIEGVPSKESSQLLELLNGNKMIKKLEIKNSLLDEKKLEAIENMRVTTNIKKQDIKLWSNTIVINNVVLLIYYFSLNNLNKICEANEIQFTDNNAKNSSKKSAKHQAGTTILLGARVLEKLRRNDQWKSLWSSLKSESQITTLELSFKELQGSNNEFSDVMDFIQGLKLLENLKLIINKYQTKEIKVLWKAIRSSSTLKKLHLELNGTENGLNFVRVRDALASLPSLQHLSLHLKEFRMVSDEDFNRLRSGLMSLKNLQHLSLEFSDCQDVSDGALNYLKNGIISLTSLQHLSLGFFNSKLITDDGLNSLKNSLLFLTSLQHLSLNFSGCRKISDDGLNLLKEGLVPLTSLQHLSLDFSTCFQISDEGLNSLKNGIKLLTSLQHLSLNFAHCDMISDEGLYYLKDGFIPLISLKDLTLEFDSCKKISIEGPNYLKAGLFLLWSLKNFKMFLIDCPRISRKEKDRLENEIRSFPSFPYTSIL